MLYSEVDLRSIFCFITEQFWNREFYLVQVVWVQMLNLIILGFNFKFNTSNTVFMHLSICRCAKVLHCKHGKFPKNREMFFVSLLPIRSMNQNISQTLQKTPSWL